MKNKKYEKLFTHDLSNDVFAIPVNVLDSNGKVKENYILVEAPFADVNVIGTDKVVRISNEELKLNYNN